MTVAPGTRLGPYEILSPLGAGGMGEVYRARDSRLERDAAVKVLPEALASNAERLKRFEKEARSASALNHPNIVTVYDIGTTDGVSWIAMERVDGETLRKLTVPGPLPLKKLLAYGTQIAEGLAKAHATGIVHLRELAALVQLSQKLVCVDSLPLHMASALKKPVVVLFGPDLGHHVGPGGKIRMP